MFNTILIKPIFCLPSEVFYYVKIGVVLIFEMLMIEKKIVNYCKINTFLATRRI